MEENVWLETILNKQGTEQSIARVLNISTENAVPEGNNYTSIICRITLDVIYKSGRRSKLTLIMKKMHENKDKADVLEEFSVFKGEVKVYTDILTKFDQLMEDYQDNRGKLWCNLLGYKPFTDLVFEDLKRENFIMADRKKLLDKNHALLVLNNLGRFHAMGHILIEKGLISKTDLQPFYIERDSPVVANLLEGGLRQLRHVIKNDWSSEWKEVAERLGKLENVMLSKLKELFKLRDDCFLTFCHGDCWTCNMMFKYCPYDEKIPIELRFLDFQTSHFNSYAFDIVYFLYISVLPEVRRADLNELLQEYHKSLKSSLALYGKEEKTPSIEQINVELKRLELYAMAMNIIYLPLTCADTEKALQLEKLSVNYDGMNAFNPKIFQSEKFKTWVQFELKHWLKEGLY